MQLMRRHSFRHLPICDGKRLLAVVSLRDLLLHDLTEKDHEVRMMRAYIHSVPGRLERARGVVPRARADTCPLDTSV